MEGMLRKLGAQTALSPAVQAAAVTRLLAMQPPAGDVAPLVALAADWACAGRTEPALALVTGLRAQAPAVADALTPSITTRLVLQIDPARQTWEAIHYKQKSKTQKINWY
jgi:hypothetical protein